MSSMLRFPACIKSRDPRVPTGVAREPDGLVAFTCYLPTLLSLPSSPDRCSLGSLAAPSSPLLTGHGGAKRRPPTSSRQSPLSREQIEISRFFADIFITGITLFSRINVTPRYIYISRIPVTQRDLHLRTIHTRTRVYMYINKQRVSLADLFSRNPRGIESLFMRGGRGWGKGRGKREERKREKRKKKKKKKKKTETRTRAVRSPRSHRKIAARIVVTDTR